MGKLTSIQKIKNLTNYLLATQFYDAMNEKEFRQKCLHLIDHIVDFGFSSEWHIIKQELAEIRSSFKKYMQQNTLLSKFEIEEYAIVVTFLLRQALVSKRIDNNRLEDFDWIFESLSSLENR